MNDQPFLSKRTTVALTREFHYEIKLEAIKRRITIESLLQEMYSLYRHKYPHKPL